MPGNDSIIPYILYIAIVVVFIVVLKMPNKKK